jgi:hypothetical protein
MQVVDISLLIITIILGIWCVCKKEPNSGGAAFWFAISFILMLWIMFTTPGHDHGAACANDPSCVEDVEDNGP